MKREPKTGARGGAGATRAKRGRTVVDGEAIVRAFARARGLRVTNARTRVAGVDELLDRRVELIRDGRHVAIDASVHHFYITVAVESDLLFIVGEPSASRLATLTEFPRPVDPRLSPGVYGHDSSAFPNLFRERPPGWT